ncbi:MAG: fatty acid desaturase [Vampirovibrionales bacterium]|nr:fatty acid desaturase [Vampirovibrionales bacterium]
MATSAIFPAYATRGRFNAPLLATYIVLHIAALAAPFTFSWAGAAAFLGLYFLTICLGIALCYHRVLAHQSCQMARPLKFLLALLACLAYQRGPIWWVACHRLHHRRVDRDGDPHSPRNSFWWSHFLWAFFRHPQLDEARETTQRLAPDLQRDPGMRFLERHYVSINAIFLATLFAAGAYWGGWRLGVSLLVWGGFLRIIAGLNATWFVNSAAHLWGYRSFETADTSRNNWWVALLTWGEGWHNNHHAHPRSARCGRAWYEMDVTYGMIRVFKACGWATRVAV